MPLPEYNTDLVTTAEEDRIVKVFNGINGDLDYRDGYLIRSGQTRKNYLTNVKRQISTEQTGLSQELNATKDSVYEHLDWQTRFQEAKQQADNANRNDWDIIADMGGTAPVRADRIEYLGNIDYELNYQQITQSAPVIDNGTPLGTTGSFSYTRANGTLFSHKEFKQHGFIHIMIETNTEKLYEESTPKELLKLQVDDFYRPTLAKKEVAILKLGEVNNSRDTSKSPQDAIGYQPPWAEYKRMPNLVTGEMRTKRLTATGTRPQPVSNSQWHNIPSADEHLEIIKPEYFNNSIEVNEVLARNNVMQLQYWGDNFEFKFIDDPIMNMSEHTVTMARPIEEKALRQVSKASQSR